MRSLMASGALSFSDGPPPIAAQTEAPPVASDGEQVPVPVPGDPPTLVGGERVRILGLGKAPHFNEYVGKVSELRSDGSGRAVVDLVYMGEPKHLALLPANLRLLDPEGNRRSTLSGKVTDVVDSLSTGMAGRQRGTKQSLDSAANLMKRFAEIGETIAPKASIEAQTVRIERLVEAAIGETADGDKRGRFSFLAPDWPEEVLVELACMYFQVCGRDMVTSLQQANSQPDSEDFADVCRMIDLVEALMIELRPEAQKMEEEGTNVEPEPEPELDLEVEMETFDAIAHAMFERYQVSGRVDKDCFNRMGVDMERGDAAEMPENIWDRICDDVGAATEAGFNFFQFGDFFKKNQGGLAQLHAGVYNVNLDSVCQREDWEKSLWDDMPYKPGARIELSGLVGSAHFNGKIGTVMGLHRKKDRYCVQLDPIGDVPHEGEEVKHLSIKGVNLLPSDVQREGFRSKHWSTMRVLRPTAPKFNPNLTDENIAAMSLGEMKSMLEPFGGHGGLLEKRDFVERLMNLRNAAASGGSSEVNARGESKVVAAPVPIVPTAKEVMPIDAELTDEGIEEMSLADIKEILKFHGGYVGLVEKVDYQSRLKELVAGERASIEATQREMERDAREQEEERKRRQQEQEEDDAADEICASVGRQQQEEVSSQVLCCCLRCMGLCGLIACVCSSRSEQPRRR